VSSLNDYEDVALSQLDLSNTLHAMRQFLAQNGQAATA
jgi:hypothetical protein